jgi:hypothetical protein
MDLNGHVIRVSDSNEKRNEIRRERRKIKNAMLVNHTCPSYLGIHVAERALSKFFKNITRMPMNNIGYDYVCGKGFKIDVKCSCIIHGDVDYWHFTINENQIADYFLCLAFDNREDLTPMHVWLIPGHIVNTLKGFSISNRTRSLHKWSKYERPLDKVITCCNEMKQTT